MLFIVSTILKIVDIYYLILLAYALLSWVPSLYASPIGRLLAWLVEPVLKPFRRLNLQFFGLDWTIFLVMILLRVATSILIRFLFLF